MHPFITYKKTWHAKPKIILSLITYAYKTFFSWKSKHAKTRAKLARCWWTTHLSPLLLFKLSRSWGKYRYILVSCNLVIHCTVIFDVVKSKSVMFQQTEISLYCLPSIWESKSLSVKQTQDQRSRTQIYSFWGEKNTSVSITKVSIEIVLIFQPCRSELGSTNAPVCYPFSASVESSGCYWRRIQFRISTGRRWQRSKVRTSAVKHLTGILYNNNNITI